MTVRELIERLNECDASWEVWVDDNANSYFTPTRIEATMFQGHGPTVVEIGR